MSILFGPGESPFQSSSKGRGKGNQGKSSSSSNNKHEELLVFGYECKFFRDDIVATDVNNGRTLIPWMGNNDLMIDRFVYSSYIFFFFLIVVLR